MTDIGDMSVLKLPPLLLLSRCLLVRQVVKCDPCSMHNISKVAFLPPPPLVFSPRSPCILCPRSPTPTLVPQQFIDDFLTDTFLRLRIKLTVFAPTFQIACLPNSLHGTGIDCDSLTSRLQVEEPEKCKYRVTVNSVAGCATNKPPPAASCPHLCDTSTFTCNFFSVR